MYLLLPEISSLGLRLVSSAVARRFMTGCSSRRIRAAGAARMAAVCVTGAGCVLIGLALLSFLQARWATHVEADGVYR